MGCDSAGDRRGSGDVDVRFLWYHIPYMVKTTVYLDDEVALNLRHLAEIEGRSQAELIRDALKTFTSQRVRPMPTGIGEFHSGHSDTSVRAKEILREASKRGKWRA
jgi:hypothetical protein